MDEETQNTIKIVKEILMRIEKFSEEEGIQALADVALDELEKLEK